VGNIPLIDEAALEFEGDGAVTGLAFVPDDEMLRVRKVVPPDFIHVSTTQSMV
jgi:hypothetical protein